MVLDTIFSAANNKLRSAVKRIGMGGYVNSLSSSGPLLNELNRRGNKFAFKNCKIFDGIQPELKENMTLLINMEKIENVGPAEQVSIPDDYFVIDGTDQTIMPGFIDSHTHICSPFTYDVNLASIRQMKKQIALNNMQTVYSGVTTVCDMGGPQGLIREFQSYSDNNRIPGPRYQNCFTLISPSKGKILGYPNQVKTLDFFQAWLLEGQVATRPGTIKDLKKFCYKVKDDGGAHIKTTYQPQPFSAKTYLNQDDFPIFTDDWMRTILKFGKETDLIVSIHSPFAAGTEKCVDLAIEVGAEIRIQHMTFDSDLDQMTIHKMKDYGYYIIPTVMVYGDSFKMPKFVSWLDKNPESYMTPEANRQIKASIKKTIELEPYSGQEILELDNKYFRRNFDFVRRNTQRAHDAGIIGFGTDSGGTYTGFFGRIFSEIEHYSEFGIPPFDILKYMTSVNAKINRLEDRGDIKPGMLADIISIKGDLLQDLSVLKNIHTVIKGGVFLKYEGVELMPT